MASMLPWVVLNTLQAGALLALAAAFGADALRRKDRMMGWLFLACLGISLRHTFLILQDTNLMSYDLAERLQALMASVGLTGSSIALWRAFRPYFHFNLPLCIGFFLVVNTLRCLFLPLGTPFEKGLHVAILLSYPFVHTTTLIAVRRAYKARDLVSLRLMGGFVISIIPLLVEIFVQLCFKIRVPLSGIACMLMSISMGVSWFWVINHGFEQKVRNLEEQAAAWRSMVPGATWNTEEPSPLMESLFGAKWVQELQDQLQGHDGRRYLLHRVPLKPHGEVGWLEAGKERDGVPDAFLKGWRLALGVEGVEDYHLIRGWLEDWGAEVEPWGTVPPREGPFPSLIIWGREPSILSVWREYELIRRRCRWVQVGGARIDGPHARLESPPEQTALRKVLETILAVHA